MTPEGFSFGTVKRMLRQMANQTNKELRHCRIGKVTEKQPKKLVGPYLFEPGDALWRPPFPGVFSLPSMSGGVFA